MRQRAFSVLCLALPGLLTAACGGEPELVAEGSAEQAPLQIVLPPEPEVDETPPEFGGIVSVELLGARTWRVRWEPARDDVALAGMIEYQVLHVAEPWRAPAATDTPVAASLPGALDVEVTVDAPSGRFFVRAVDPSGNRSDWGEGLEQRATRPWLRAPDRGPLAEVIDCAIFEAGRALCAGSNGFTARWDRDRWVGLSATDGVDLHVVTTAAEPWIFSDTGHLYRFTPEGDLEPHGLRFLDATPDLPLRQFARDHLGLSWWIDAGGRLFIGAEDRFRLVRYVLGLPDPTQCGPLRGLAFSSAALFAFCDTGSVFSVSTSQPELMWLPLTSQIPFDIDGGIETLAASDDASAWVLAGGGVRRVGVGGWTDGVLEGVPLGAEQPSLVPSRVGRPAILRGGVHVPTDLGVVVIHEGRARLLPGTEGDAVAAISPGPLEPQDQVTVVYSDGAVARVRGGRRVWAVEPPMAGFVLAGRAADGTLLAMTRGDAPGIWALQANRWRRLTSSVPTSSDRLFLASTLGGSLTGASLFVAGTLDAQGVIYEYSGGRWVAAPLLYAAPPAPVPEMAPGEVMDFALPETEPVVAAPPVLTELGGVPASEWSVPPPPLGRVIALDVAGDGRAIAATDSQVWWRTARGWRLLVERLEADIEQVALDAGHSWVLVAGGGITRCWRDECGAPIAPVAPAPPEVVAAWRDAGGLATMAADGSVWTFARAALPDTARGPQPAETTPAGSFAQTAPPQASPSGVGVRQRIWRDDGLDVLWTDDGALSTLVEGSWLAQGFLDDGLGLTLVADGWAALSTRGLLTLGDVPIVTRADAGEAPR